MTSDAGDAAGRSVVEGELRVWKGHAPTEIPAFTHEVLLYQMTTAMR